MVRVLRRFTCPDCGKEFVSEGPFCPHCEKAKLPPCPTCHGTGRIPSPSPPTVTISDDASS